MSSLLSIEYRERNLRTYYGYYLDKIEGKEGSILVKSYKAFQKRQGLATNGYGPITDTRLRECIKNLQTLLNKYGYKLVVDGKAGPATVNAIMDFQKKHGLYVDGIAGKATFAKLNNSTQTNVLNINLSNSWDGITHFTRAEFACKDGCGKDGISPKLVHILEYIRAYFGGREVIITSGCRCVKHNAEVGGVKGSKHIDNLAADFYIKGVSINEVMKLTKYLVSIGILKYTYTGGYKNGQMNGICHINI